MHMQFLTNVRILETEALSHQSSFERGIKGGLHQSSQALSAAPSPLVSEAAIMNLYLSSMFIAVDPFIERLDTAVLASFSAAAASLSFLLATYSVNSSNLQSLRKH